MVDGSAMGTRRTDSGRRAAEGDSPGGAQAGERRVPIAGDPGVLSAWRHACPVNCKVEMPACLRMMLWRVPGLYIVTKPSGPSSFDVIRAARREFGVRKIGHAGTLDPLAEGVLVLGVGRATRLLSVLSGLDKSYRASVRFGVRTDTFDTTGRVLEERDVLNLTEERVREALAGFRGFIEQLPPMYSALKKDGQPLYKLARRGIEVEREPRSVEITRLELVEFSMGTRRTDCCRGLRRGTPRGSLKRASVVSPLPNDRPEATLEVDCSKGTYVRSLVEDIGQALGTGAVMTALVRTRVGPFGIEMARQLGGLAG